MFTLNIGGWDKAARIVLGLGLLALGALGPIGWWGIVGLVPLLTGLMGICPLYTLLGIDTCPATKSAL